MPSLLPTGFSIATMVAGSTTVVTAFGGVIVLAVGITLGLRFIPKIVRMAKGGR